MIHSPITQLSTVQVRPDRRGRRPGAYLSEGGPPALRLDGDGLGAALEDLVDVLLAELGTLVLLVHDGPVGPAPQQVLNLLLRQLLLRRLGNQRGEKGEERTGADCLHGWLGEVLFCCINSTHRLDGLLFSVIRICVFPRGSCRRVGCSVAGSLDGPFWGPMNICYKKKHIGSV